MAETRLIDCTPLVPVTDIEKGIAFFTEILGFEARAVQDTYAYLKRDGAAIRLIQAAPDMDMVGDPKRQLSCYIDVEGVDALFEAQRHKLETLPKGHLRPPFNQDYGQREFHVIFEALLIFFGETRTD